MEGLVHAGDTPLDISTLDCPSKTINVLSHCPVPPGGYAGLNGEK